MTKWTAPVVALLILSCTTPEVAATAPAQQTQAPPPPAPVARPIPTDPASACRLMVTSSRFQVGAWKDREIPDESGNQWGCSSGYVTLDPKFVDVPNNIAFYALGNEREVKLLKLVLNVNHPDAKAGATEYLASSVERMTMEGFGAAVPANALESIKAGQPTSFAVEGKRAVVELEPFAKGGIKGGFTMRYVVAL
jgi:hypothetical protein